MTNTVLKEASLEDLSKLLELEQKIIDSERPYDQDIKLDKVTYYDIEDLISSPDSHVVVVESNSTVVGSGYAKIRASKLCHTHDTHCYLGFIYVEPEHRGKALSAQIIDKLKQWGVGRGVTHFFLDVYTENVSAVRAYEKMGFKKALVSMELSV